MIALVDAENVRRSTWPNVPPQRLVELLGGWADAQGVQAIAVFDGAAPEGVADVEVVGTGPESADDWIARRAGEVDGPYMLVTSDRELRARAGGSAATVVGGGQFVRELQAVAGGESPSS